jgi:hypothetical protein
MAEDERRALVSIWVAICTFVSLWYLSESFWKAASAGAFVFGSMVLGLGARWLSRAALILPVIALVVAFKFSMSENWLDIFLSAKSVFAQKVSSMP